MSGLGDTLINIVIFVFIGLLIWLYVKPGGGDGDSR
jgi:hypothetical protein